MMMPAAFLLLILLAGEGSTEKVCSYHDIVDHLNLTAGTGVFRLTRPVLDHRRPTVVQLDVFLFAILAVTEKTQVFIPFVWAAMTWTNERISWDPAQFCGITEMSVPKELLWEPDLFIYEMIHKHETATMPYSYITHNGTVYSEDVMKLVSTCQMDLHKFPFDTQRCNVSFGSAVHCVEEIRFVPLSNSTRITQFSREVMQTQGDWDFLQLVVTSRNFSFNNRQWDQIVYTFTMKRRPLLHVINFLLPVLFFLSLDLASFFISDHRGEKLSFKVTVLLALSVLLLILNDILPSMSNRTPLIATYCIVTFGLMLLSLLETILVTYLMDCHFSAHDNLRLKGDEQEEARTAKWEAEEKRQTCSTDICVSTGERQQQEQPPVAEEVIGGGGGGSPEERAMLLLILDELRRLQSTVNEQLSGRREGGKCLHWASRINKAFFIFYVATVSLFLSLIFTEWIS